MAGAPITRPTQSRTVRPSQRGKQSSNLDFTAILAIGLLFLAVILGIVIFQMKQPHFTIGQDEVLVDKLNGNYSMAIKMGERFDLPITATPLHGRSELIDATTALAYKGNTDGIRVDVHVCKGDVFDLRFGWHYTPAISACHPRTL
jgi:hypothetical protein